MSSVEAVVQRCSVKKFLEISQNSQENTCARVSFLIKLIKKETLAKVFFLRTPFFTEHLWWMLLQVADTMAIEKWIKELAAKIKLISHDSNLDDKNLMKELNKPSLEQGIYQNPFT